MGERNSKITGQEETNMSIMTYVKFGMISKKCRSFGICEVKRIKKPSASLIKSREKTICSMKVMENKQLKCDFYLSNIIATGGLKYFKNGYFQMGEAYCLPAYISASLGSDPFEIKAGIHPVYQSDEQRIVVLFDLNYLVDTNLHKPKKKFVLL